ncbi:MAG: N-acetylmuramoyl-L-alanine amidase family protein [Flavisolibacter sp.]
MLKKTLVLLSIIAGSALLYSFTKVKPQQQVLRTIIIDAGHGIMKNGGHNGAKGSYSYEDDICLAVSKKLVSMVSKELPDVKIVETRPTKYITDLHERADIANQNRGDLFVSIHVNAMPPIQKREFLGYKTEVYYTGKGKKRRKHTKKVAKYRYYEVPNTTTKGTQTYIWGAHKSEDKEVAVRENAPMLAEDNYKEKYGDIDPNSPEFVALSLVKTKQFGKRSVTLAEMVEEQFAKVGRISGGAHQRQIGIWVLQATAMPSILVETGFITNPQEEEYLNSESGQTEIAQCITNALKNYVDWLQKKQTSPNSVTSFNSSNTKNAHAFLEAVENKEKNTRAK